MKRLFGMILLGIVGTVFGNEGHLSFTGQIRQRYEMVDKDFSDTTGFNNQNYLRTRFAISYKNEDMMTVVQIQDSRIFGTETSTLKDGSADALDVHQAYFKLNSIYGLPLNAKVGRFEVNYGPQRLVGAVGWHNIGRSFDGVIFNTGNSLFDVDIFNFKQVEAGAIGDNGDYDVRGVYANLKLMGGHTTQAFYIQDKDRITLGGYGKGTVSMLSYEAEFATQSGAESNNVDFGGLMYAFNGGIKVAGMTLSAGIDFISGDDTTTTDVNEAFSTLYATNHKYYGFMDYFLNLPVHTSGLGLQDLHLKMSGLKLVGHSLNAAYHIFNADQSSDSFGNELDLTVIHKMADNVKLVGGYSIFMPGKLKSENGSNATFAYLMTIVNF